ncbi:monocarboxylate transporter 14 [Galendromus occidentalis]|uniref:Monocarboxylate transporter 14 n=1 Tax=Galendromus occidentalis TaxID=34638 RepID=A0AAJ6QX86_9ACAR|nr:monocarboxylate transporter 14 [Galendromus occidentalis]
MTGDAVIRGAKTPKAGPDGRESWRMVLACFTTTFLVGGSTRSAAVLYVAVMETFNVTRGEAAWPISLISGFVNFAGILSGPLSTKLGLRITCIIGGSMSFVCLTASYFATGIPYLTISFGILNGIGIGLMYNLNPVILSHYFREYKGLALGINYCGSTVAAMVFPKFMEYLYRSFGLRGLFLIFAAIMLNTPVISYLMHKPPWTRKKMLAPNIGREFIRRMTSASNRESRAPSMDGAAELEDNRDRSTSISVAGVKPGKKNADLVLATDIGIGVLPMTIGGEEENNCDDEANPHLDNVTVREDNTMPSIDNFPHLSTIRSISEIVEASSPDAEGEEDVPDPEPELSLREIFCNPLFYLLIVSYLVFTTYTDILFTVIVDLFCDKGVDQPLAIATIPLVSITDMAGRIALPLIADKGIVDRKVVFAINFLCLGASACIIPLVSGYVALTAMFLLVGWFYGSTVVMCTVIVSDLLGVHNLAVANGLICSSVGFIAFGRPAFIGFFRDTVGSYDPMLYFWGAGCLSMAAVWSVVLLALRRAKKER